VETSDPEDTDSELGEENIITATKYASTQHSLEINSDNHPVAVARSSSADMCSGCKEVKKQLSGLENSLLLLRSEMAEVRGALTNMSETCQKTYSILSSYKSKKVKFYLVSNLECVSWYCISECNYAIYSSCSGFCGSISDQFKPCCAND
jgi:hypothetical protein